VPNAFPYIHCLETEKGGYLIRQYLYSSLYDRIRCISSRYSTDRNSTRPFLEPIEKRWIAFQLLCGLRDCHAKGVWPKFTPQVLISRFTTETSKQRMSSLPPGTGLISPTLPALNPHTSPKTTPQTFHSSLIPRFAACVMSPQNVSSRVEKQRRGV
jgi:hypothetical protein